MGTTNHAIVFGAAGLLGWSVVNQLLSNYPEAGTFAKVTAVINRPVAEKDMYWPGETSGRPELQIVSGVDLLQGTGENLANVLREKVRDVGGITHAFYFGKIPSTIIELYGANITGLPQCFRLLTKIRCRNATQTVA